MIKINLPTDEAAIRQLNVGDEISICGLIVTARDAAHKVMIEQWPKFVDPLIRNGAIYHCGPVMKKTGKTWKAIAAGPTTSIREEPYQASVISHYKVRLIIGKGGMGDKTLAACKKLGAVYVHAIGGAAPLIADKIVRVRGVNMLDDLGIPEAFWEFEVDDLKGIVTMDSNGQSLHKKILANSQKQRDKILGL